MAFSKSRVDKAGRELSEYLVATVRGEAPALSGADAAEMRESLQAVEWWRREHARPLSRVAANLRYYAAEHGNPTVAQRLKKVPTIAGKLLRERSMRLSQMADIGGVRAVLPRLDDVSRVSARLRHNWTIVDTSDYVTKPKADGYRAVHLINKHRGRLIEVQLRTPRQHAWANAVERDARSIAPGLKWGVGPTILLDYYRAVGELFAVVDSGLDPPAALIAEAERLQMQAATFRAQQTSR